ncbi:507_t:CDS:2, partial [Acaulospora colombiana]
AWMSSRPRQTRLPAPKKGPTSTKPRHDERIRTKSSTPVPSSQLFETLTRLETTTDNVLGDLESLLKSATSEQANKFAMKAFNAVAGAIAAALKAGLTADGDSNPLDQGKLRTSIDVSMMSLGILRQSYSLSTERAALSLASRLISLNLEPVCLKLDGRVSSLDADSLNTCLTYLSCAFQVFLQPLDGLVRFKEDMDLLSDFIQSNEAGTFLSWTRDLRVIDVEKLLPMASAIMKSVETSFGLLSPINAMILRFYALQCTADVSSPDKLSWVWKHALNISASYIKAITLRKKEEFNPLDESLKVLIRVLQSREQHSATLFNEESFSLLCREWCKLALRVKESNSVQFIQSLLAPNTQESKTIAEIDVLESISQKTRELEISLQAKDRSEITHCLEQLQLERTNDDSIKQTNMFQTMERLRRRMKNSLSIQKEPEFVNGMHKPLILISDVYDAILRLGKLNNDYRMDVITATVENRILISKLQINLTLADTYEPAYQSLLKAHELMLLNDVVNDHQIGDRVIDLWRCLSGAFWNIGSSIYQTGRWDHSVPFISSSVDIDRRLLGDERRLTQSRNDPWQDSKFSPIKVVIEKTTHLGVFELLLGDEVILRSLVESLHFPPAVIGAILECQIDYLEQYIWKDDVPKLIKGLLWICSGKYSDNHPMRHARLLGRQLEYIYYMKQPWKDAEDAGTKAITLLSHQKLNSDANIRTYEQQYLLQ